jgi:D-glycero-D-manno-heptose 1,7-bisphosphate phosphatase
MNRAVFLDRDGVINAMMYNPEFGLVDSPANPAEFRLLPGCGQAIRRINELGYLAIVVSNQPGIAKGKFSPALLQAMTEKMVRDLLQDGARLDAIYYCRHHPEGSVSEYRQACECRKPRPGMILQAAADHNIDLRRSFLVGDGLTDVSAGQAAGVTTVLVYNSSRLYLLEELARQNVEPDRVVGSLPKAVQWIEGLETQRRAHLYSVEDIS